MWLLILKEGNQSHAGNKNDIVSKYWSGLCTHTHTHKKEESLFWNQKVPAELITLSLTLRNTYILTCIQHQIIAIHSKKICCWEYFMSRFESSVRPSVCTQIITTQNEIWYWYILCPTIKHTFTSILSRNLGYWLLFSS